MRGMAQARLDSSATSTSNPSLEVIFTGDIPQTVGGAITVTLIDQVFETGKVVLDILKQKDAVDKAAVWACRTGEDHGELVERRRRQLLVINDKK